jgi:hypothetical protein
VEALRTEFVSGPVGGALPALARVAAAEDAAFVAAKQVGVQMLGRSTRAKKIVKAGLHLFFG